jgi:hypothetical protein
LNTPLVSGLTSPTGIAVSSTNVYVANFNLGTIGEYDAVTGAAINTALVTGLDGSSGIAISGNDLFVTTTGDGTVGAGSVLEYDATTGALINPSLVTGLNYPVGVTVSGSNLFVVNNGGGAVSGSIGEYTTAGVTVNAALVTGLNDFPQYLAVFGTSLFVTNETAGTSSSGSIGEYDIATGSPINAALVTGLFQPFGIAVVGPLVPEPSTFVLGIAGLAGLILVAMRKTNRHVQRAPAA